MTHNLWVIWHYIENLAKPGKKPPSILPENPSDCEKDFLELLSINEDADWDSNERRKGKLVDLLAELPCPYDDLNETAQSVAPTPKESVWVPK